MGRHKIEKVKVNKKFFMDTVHKLGSSIRKLGEEKTNEDVNNFEGVNRDEKTIRRYLNSGEMPIDLLDRIAKYLNVDPDYLSGKIAEPIYKIDDVHTQKYFTKLENPKFFPYRKRKKTIKYIQNMGHIGMVLNLYGISTEQIDKLPSEDRVPMYMEIDEAILRILNKYFKVDSDGNCFENILIYFLDNYIDFYLHYAEMERLDVFGPNIFNDVSDEDPFAEKYKDKTANN